MVKFTNKLKYPLQETPPYFRLLATARAANIKIAAPTVTALIANAGERLRRLDPQAGGATQIGTKHITNKVQREKRSVQVSD